MVDKAMKKFKLFSLPRLSSGQSGQALILVMIFLLLGSLTLVPTLTHISTALKTGQTYEQNTNELYTADSGIEDALWRIKYDYMSPDLMGLTYNPYDFETTFLYETENINNMAANFTIANVWFPTDVNFTDPFAPGFIDMSPGEIKDMIDSEKLIVSGSNIYSDNVSPYTYKIMIDFNPDAGDNLTIKSLGVWLPRGFTYTDNSCSLQVGGHSHPYNPDHVSVTETPGGTAVLWSYDTPYPDISDFPGYDPQEYTFDFTLGYTKDDPNSWPAAIAWTTTEMLHSGVPQPPSANSVPVSWDIDTRYFKIVSTAGDAQIQAYSSKNDLRQLGDAISGDYVAIGNSLLADDNGDHKRETWHAPSSYTVTSIPSDADVIYAFLYWAGWRNENAVQAIFSDDCSDFDNWVRTFGPIVSQTRVPTGDYNGSGFSSSPYWSKVDETTPNDGDYITGTTDSGGYRLFNFSDFTVPSGSKIDNVTIYFRAKDVSGTNPNNNLRASIYVQNTRYDASTSVDPGSGWTTYSYTWDKNPETGNPWTWQEVNGGSSHPLVHFGVYGSDFNPDIQVSMVYAMVQYYDSRWTVTSGGNPEFEGAATGVADPAPRVLTLKNSIDLTSHGSGIFNISWDQSESGNLSDNDIFYYAFSGDNGTTWSPYYEAFRGNDPASPFTTAIPADYITSAFKVRFYFNFNSSSESVFLDNIRITYLPVDTGVTFKINDQQVYLNGSEPAVGPHDVTAGRSYAMLNTMWGNPYGFSYMCVRDVTALVKKYPIVPDEEHHTGNAKYTVDGVSADIRNPDNSLSDFAFAGWSLIIVYASPESAGHYIYIRDDNFAFHPGTGGDLDFDEDGAPGGTIRDFVVPNPITDKYGHIIETVAAKLTVFVVEGDDFGNDTSSIVVTGQQSGLSKSLTEPVGRINDVINSRSWPGTFNEGVDIDTFEIKWSDGILTPKDKQLQVDMYSLNDAWNLVYFIISIRSETVTSGTTYYTITGG
jgi:hypothetical protein